MKIFAAVFIAILFLAVTSRSQTSILPDAEIQGRQLAQQLCETQPAESFTNSGVLQIRDSNGKRFDFPIAFEIVVTATNWQSVYETIQTLTNGFSYHNQLKITHSSGQPNRYGFYLPNRSGVRSANGDTLNWSEANSTWAFNDTFGDFYPVDLGLEFFHWPQQKVLKKEVKRSRGCTVLESANPNPSTNGYSRVVSWIDNESGGIVQAQAYDAANKLLKEFYPKDFKKVDGQWQVQMMQIENVQTGSRSRLEFDVDKP